MQSTTFKGHASCTGTTGNPAVTLRSATVTGSLHNSSPVTCNDVLGVPEAKAVSGPAAKLDAGALSSQSLIGGLVRWKARQAKVFDSQVSFDAYAFVGGVYSVPYPGGNAGVLSGSYHGEQFSSTATGLRYTGRCNRKSGIRSMHFGIAAFKIQP